VEEAVNLREERVVIDADQRIMERRRMKILLRANSRSSSGTKRPVFEKTARITEEVVVH
jgi:hypothetical protein